MLIAETLREGLRSATADRVRTGATGAHAFASEAGTCSRKVAYDLIDGRPEWNPTLTQEVAFRIGKDLESAVIAAARLQNPTTRTQVPWTLEDGLISGVADGVYVQQAGPTVARGATINLWEPSNAPEPPEGATVIMEIKSMADRYFRQAMKSGPELGHQLQAMLGAVAMGTGWVHVVYVSKGAKSTEDPILEWHLPVDQDLVKVAVEDLVLAVESARRGEVPPPWSLGELIESPNPRRPPCLWCPHVERCELAGVPADAWQRRMNGTVRPRARGHHQAE